MGTIIGLGGGLFIILLAFVVSRFHNIPHLVGPDPAEDPSATTLKTYKIIGTDGTEETIITTKSIKELISELDYCAFKHSQKCIS